MELQKPKIENMGMGELRNYMCQKSGGNPKTCYSCPGLKTCTAGQRAMVLIRESEIKAERPENEMQHFKLACESGNPWGWLENTLKISKDQAKEKLIGWVNKYPAISREYGGQKQIMRYRPFLAQEAASEVKVEEIPAEENKPGNGAKTPSGERMRERARQLCETAIQSGNPRKYLMEELGLTSHQASCRVTAWRKMYKDIFEKYTVPYGHGGGVKKLSEERIEKMKVGRASTGRKRAEEYWKEVFSQPDPVAYHMKHNNVSKETAQTVVSKAKKKYAEVLKPVNNEDEVSLSDWLDEMEPKEKPVNPVQVELQKKHGELKAEKEQLEREIEEKLKRLVLISEQEDALYKVLEMFK